ncbi:MAG: dihydroxy-acid dehydratase [Parvularculaceae bacterium]|nr:dihydroxy-acid dehydratase [Parvularculaceae bacterium]
MEAPAAVYDDQDAFLADFKQGKLHRDVVAVVRCQGPRANGMPELHKLTPALGVLQDRGFKVALVTDGRMSGASGKVPAAIHLTPEAERGGPIARIRDGDVLRLDAERGRLDILVQPDAFAARAPAQADLGPRRRGLGRELFSVFRAAASSAEEGATSLPFDEATASTGAGR